MINENSIKKLELRTVLNIAAEFAQSASAKELLLSLEPTQDRERAEYLLAETSDAVKLINYYNVYPSFGFDSVRECADKAKFSRRFRSGNFSAKDECSELPAK